MLGNVGISLSLIMIFSLTDRLLPGLGLNSLKKPRTGLHLVIGLIDATEPCVHSTPNKNVVCALHIKVHVH